MDTSRAQPRILSPLPALARALWFSVVPERQPADGLRRLRDAFVPDWGVVGIGEPLVRALGASVAGLRTFPALSGVGVENPSTQHALWVRLHGDDRGLLFDREMEVVDALRDAFAMTDAIDTFRYREGRDLSGYEDGTENPKGEAAAEAALVASGEGLEGSSFVAIQRWVHDLARFRRFNPAERDAIMGRHFETNEELDDAPASVHVKRSEQESFDPPAFMWRRSMPFVTTGGQGLEFVAYVESLDRFERMLRRMAGLDDGIVDGLFTFSRPVTGGYYWCPPVAHGRLDLRRLEL
jgi:putative iron-dependent peroxidase